MFQTMSKLGGQIQFGSWQTHTTGVCIRFTIYSRLVCSVINLLGPFQYLYRENNGQKAITPRCELNKETQCQWLI